MNKFTGVEKGMQQQVIVLASFSDNPCTNIFLPLFCTYWATAYFYTSSNMQHLFDLHPLNPKP
jgi:hypothetical protein